MKKATYLFYLSIGYSNAARNEKVTLEFDDDATEDEMSDAAVEAWSDWRDQHCDGGPGDPIKIETVSE